MPVSLNYMGVSPAIPWSLLLPCVYNSATSLYIHVFVQLCLSLSQSHLLYYSSASWSHSPVIPLCLSIPSLFLAPLQPSLHPYLLHSVLSPPCVCLCSPPPCSIIHPISPFPPLPSSPLFCLPLSYTQSWNCWRDECRVTGGNLSVEGGSHQWSSRAGWPGPRPAQHRRSRWMC